MDAWTDLQAEIDALDECQEAQVFWVPLYDKAWLVKVLQRALGTALESPDHYEASELIDLWDAGEHEGALDGELVVTFLDTFFDKLDEAIASGDVETIDAIAAFAAAHGYVELQEKASTG